MSHRVCHAAGKCICVCVLLESLGWAFRHHSVLAAQAVLVYGTVYLFFMFIYHGASSEWVYYVLDWDQPSALALYLTLPVVLFVVFVVWCASPTNLVPSCPTFTLCMHHLLAECLPVPLLAIFAITPEAPINVGTCCTNMT